MDELLEQFLIESRELIAAALADFAVLARTPQATGSHSRPMRRAEDGGIGGLSGSREVAEGPSS